MSDEPRVTDEQVNGDDQGPPRWAAIASIVAVLVLVGLAALFFLRSRDAGPAEEPTPTPTETAPTDPATEPTEETTTPAPATAPPSPPPPDDPTARDLAAFVSEHGPADHSLQADIDGDGVAEAILGRVRQDTAHIVVGTWDGQTYQRTFRDDGGPAETLETLEARDYNGEPGLEIVTTQTVGEAGASLSIWGPEDRGITRQEARGGCWDGFHTFGISGATIEEGRISATCDGSPLPQEAWTSDIYEWIDQAWTYVETDEPGGG